METQKNNLDLSHLDNDDYQNREGGYPASGKPCTISTYKNTISLDFKNTSKNEALAWTKRWLANNNLEASRIGAMQDGDYEDDWVAVYVTI